MMTWTRDFVRIGVPIFVVPLVIAFYTPEEQTFYFMIQILFAFAIVADAGISSVVVRATSYFYAGAKKIPKNRKEFDNSEGIRGQSPNFVGITELFKTTHWIYLIITVFTVLMLSTGGVAAFWNLMSQTGHRKDMWAAYGVLVVYFGIYMSNVRWSSFMRGLDYVAQEARFTTLTTSIRIILWIILLSFKQKPLALTLSLLLEGIVFHIYYRTFINKWLRKQKVNFIGKGRFNKELFMTLWPAAWRMGGIQLGNFFVERGNNILILQIPDTALMANFTFTTWILKTIFNFSLTPVYSRLPVLFKYAAEKNFLSLKRSAAGYMFIGLSIIILAYAFIGAAGNPLLENLNVDRRIIYPLYLFIIMALTEILDIHSSFHAGVYTSTNHIPFFFPTIISGTVIFFVGLYYALPLYGVAGIIFTRFIVQLCFNNWYAMYLNLHFLKWPLSDFIVDLPKYGFRYLFSKGREFMPNNRK
jgi:hypothetical protein